MCSMTFLATYSLADLHSIVLKKVLLDPTHICIVESFSTHSDSNTNIMHESNKGTCRCCYLRHLDQTGISRATIKLRVVCILDAKNGSCKLYDSNLHPQTYAQVWDVVFSGILSSKDLAFDFSATKTSWN